MVDHYCEDWSQLGWLQIRGTATFVDRDDADHSAAVAALQEKYDQYESHDLESRPVMWIDIGHAVDWGTLDPDA